MSGNPLLNYASTAKAELKVKRRWDVLINFKRRCEPFNREFNFSSFLFTADTDAEQ